MKTLMEISGLKVTCDICDWSKSITENEVGQWHNIACPQCGKGVILDDYDLEIFHDLRNFVNKVQDMFGTVNDDDLQSYALFKVTRKKNDAV